MNLLSNTVIAFRSRRTTPAALLRVERRGITLKPMALVCRWERNRASGRLDCVWTSSDADNGTDATDYLRLAS